MHPQRRVDRAQFSFHDTTLPPCVEVPGSSRVPSLCSLVCGGQTNPHKPRLVVSHSTCSPLSPSPHAHSFVLGTAVTNNNFHHPLCLRVCRMTFTLLLGASSSIPSSASGSPFSFLLRLAFPQKTVFHTVPLPAFGKKRGACHRRRLPCSCVAERRERERSLLDKLKGVPTCQRYRRWPSDVTAARK